MEHAILKKNLLRGALAYCTWLAVAAWPAGATGEDWSDSRKEDFLLRAEIIHQQELPIGITGSKRVTMSLDGESHDAHIQTIDQIEQKVRVGGRTELVFRDSYRYNIAAYRLDRLLDLHMVPVSVERTIESRKAAVTWWVDNVLMMEKDRVERKIRPPGSRAWIEQIYRRRIFNELAFNTDYNRGNQLITGDWKIWMVDFTRAFRQEKKLFDAKNLWRPDQPLLDRLRALTREQVDDRLSCCLTRPERQALLARRDIIIQHYERLATRRAARAADN